MASSTSPAAASGRTGSKGSANAGEADWFMMTSATNHMTGDRTLISDLVPVSNQVVQEGAGKGMQVCGRGSVNTEKVVLPDVWYVPGLATNLVSAGQLSEDPDLMISFGGGACRISKKSDGSVVGRAPLRRSDMTYAVDFLKVQGKADWFMATRATNHMTGDRTLISNLVPVSNQVIEEGEGEGMQVCGRGSVNTEKVILPDVWYVPGLATNLVSVGQLTEDPDLIVQFGGGGCRVSKKSDGSVLGRAPLRRSDMKYAVDFLKVRLK